MYLCPAMISLKIIAELTIIIAQKMINEREGVSVTNTVVTKITAVTTTQFVMMIIATATNTVVVWTVMVATIFRATAMLMVTTMTVAEMGTKLIKIQARGFRIFRKGEMTAEEIAKIFPPPFLPTND